ncbi:MULTISPECIES: hypothetical protein [unclassified Paenibacillus]|uniref:hypothetical protein n=1 Tax=unclassified Paenibacillus TaxID=185978 RepID=UPI00277D90E0|nr:MULTISPECIES: hypothetical protein [unclassified Paenibacillus]MDQ0900943.1 methyl-accepting chemotaxis protein [Paenibacillus sp. V4I7]MDQ0920557.1 methyl-accepting chemotaxis protein [Paenibacillus sp. V4I5]
MTGRLSFNGKKDEIGPVSLAYNLMIRKIVQLVNEMRETGKEVTESSDRMATASVETAVSAREIHSAANQIALRNHRLQVAALCSAQLSIGEYLWSSP